MISVNEALAILNDNLPKPRVVSVDIEYALSRILAGDICSPEASPRFTSSAMDGFAVRWKDIQELKSENEVCLNVVGESQAGIPYCAVLQEGEAIRISTGSMIPQGADTVIRVEDTVEKNEKVIIKFCKRKGQDIRFAGEEFIEGEIILKKNQTLKAREIALLSAVGLSSVSVYDNPKVALIITGTELAGSGSELIKPYQVRDSNAPMLQSTIKEVGGVVGSCVQVKDDFSLTVSSIQKAVKESNDIILCSGGVSVGRHDHIKEAAKQVGFKQLFWKIKQKPGKPLFVAKFNNTLLFGLPGNPVSAFMCFQNYVLPSLARLQGGTQENKKRVASYAEVAIKNSGKRTNFIRVDLTNHPNTKPTFRPLDQQGSHMITSIVKADGYIVMEPGIELQPGDMTDVFEF